MPNPAEGARHRITVAVGETMRDAVVFLDGRKLDNVVGLTIDTGVDRLTTVTLKLLVAAEVLLDSTPVVIEPPPQEDAHAGTPK